MKFQIPTQFYSIWHPKWIFCFWSKTEAPGDTWAEKVKHHKKWITIRFFFTFSTHVSLDTLVLQFCYWNSATGNLLCMTSWRGHSLAIYWQKRCSVHDVPSPFHRECGPHILCMGPHPHVMGKQYILELISFRTHARSYPDVCGTTTTNNLALLFFFFGLDSYFLCCVHICCVWVCSSHGNSLSSFIGSYLGSSYGIPCI